MKIYIDTDYKCHVTNPDNTFREFDIDFFTDKCVTFIEGYRFIPFNETWKRSNGDVFKGELIIPWKPYLELDNAQRVYEQAQLAECKEALRELGVEVK